MMRIRAKALSACTIVAMMSVVANGRASVLEFTDKDDWLVAVGEFNTITFTEYPDSTFITDQYEALGVLFTDGDDNIACCSDSVFPNDGAGLDGNAAIHLAFLQPQQWIAADYPGTIQFELYYQDQLIHTSEPYGSGIGLFAGLISDEPFDAAIIFRPFGGVNMSIDDLHFGVPAPAAAWLLGVAALFPARRRRR